MNDTYLAYKRLKACCKRLRDDAAFRHSISVHLIAESHLKNAPSDETLYTGATVPIDTVQLPAIKMGKERAL